MIVEAKLEFAKMAAAVFAVEGLIIIPLLFIVPLLVSPDMVVYWQMGIGLLAGYLPAAALRGAWENYYKKMSEKRPWH